LDPGGILLAVTIQGVLPRGIWATNDTPASCKVHPQCATLGLTGELYHSSTMQRPGQCCPTVDGVFLDCCKARACAVHPACAALGLGDDCCSTRDGIFLDCCELNMPYFVGLSLAMPWSHLGLRNKGRVLNRRALLLNDGSMLPQDRW
jgi:hypothetical protein